MKVYALVGHSGTGKSHRAAMIAYREGLEYIIDDGLLIKGNQFLAGRSAKRENTRMGATKRAIFMDPDHAGDVKSKIKEVNVQSILIVGLSERMTKQISERLDIPYPQHIIRIEDIATQMEISKAREIRVKENRHVIPVPTFAIEKEFPGYYIDSIKSFFHGHKLSKRPHLHHTGMHMEHSIVRPLYSQLGNYFLTEQVIEQIAVFVTEEEKNVIKAGKSSIYSTANGMILNLELVIRYGSYHIPTLLLQVQKNVKEKLEYLTGFQIIQLNVTARRLAAWSIPKPKNKKSKTSLNPER